MTIRVACIDSGVNPDHPHVRPIAGGITITPDGASEGFLDLLGHGTAVAGAIREKALTAEIYAVKVFDRELATSGKILLRAIDWCLDQQMDFINLSLGTLNEAYVPAFEEKLARAKAIGTQLVAAFEMKGRPAFPGCLPSAVGVLLDPECPRHQFRETVKDGRIVYAACGFPRDIPGVPPQYNLHGISFAVANVTGYLAARVPPCPLS
ncbi:MAG: S8 family serine peptidase [Bryobacteraceae bacterium]